VTERSHMDPAEDHHPEITLHWFLRRELLSIPLFAVIVGILLVFGVSPATLLFVFLLAAVILGLIWGSAPAAKR
jgi:Na+/H+ antiporter NhaC